MFAQQLFMASSASQGRLLNQLRNLDEYDEKHRSNGDDFIRFEKEKK